MSLEAMKQALDALETHGTPLLNYEDAYSASVTALRQAIAEAEKLEQEIKDILQNYPLTSLQLLNYVESTKTLYLIYPEESNEHRSNQTNGA